MRERDIYIYIFKRFYFLTFHKDKLFDSFHSYFSTNPD